MMRVRFIAAVLTAARGVPSVAGGLPSIAPDAPRVGDTITVTYVAGGPLAAAAEVELEALLIREGDRPAVLEVPMKKAGEVWTASLALEDPKTALVLFRFASGETIDDLDGHVPYRLVRGEDGRPVRGAHYGLSLVIRTGIVREEGYHGFKLRADEAVARDHVAQERALHPESWKAALSIWNDRLKERDNAATRGAIREELSRLVERSRDDPTAQMVFIQFYERIGDKDIAARLRESAIGADPKGPVAQVVREGGIHEEKDPVKRAGLLEGYLDQCPDLPHARQDHWVSALIHASLEAGQHRRALDALARLHEPKPAHDEHVARALIQEGVLLDEPVALARRAVEARRSGTPDEPRPSWMTTQDWEKRLKGLPPPEQRLSQALLMLGTGLLATGKPDDALAPLREAYGLVGRDPRSTEVVERLARALAACGRNDELVEVGLDAARAGLATETILRSTRKAWIATSRSRKGWEPALARARDDLRAAIRAGLPAARVDRQAPAFSAKGWDGSPVSLDSLKGKVVVLEFWTST